MQLNVIDVDRLTEIVRDAVSSALAEQKPASSVPLLLTCAALCKRLGVSRASVYRWRGEGMPAIKAGDEFRYVLDEVMGWLRGRDADQTP